MNSTSSTDFQEGANLEDAGDTQSTIYVAVWGLEDIGPERCHTMPKMKDVEEESDLGSFFGGLGRVSAPYWEGLCMDGAINPLEELGTLAAPYDSDLLCGGSSDDIRLEAGCRDRVDPTSLMESEISLRVSPPA